MCHFLLITLYIKSIENIHSLKLIGKMNSFYLKLKENLGLSLILAIGLGVEFSNFQAMFFRFMSQYREDWGAFNHLPAIFLSAFLLLCIVIFGIRKQTVLSWFLAMLTCVISFSVYSRMNLSWEWENMSEVHFVILILSGMLPMLVAYTTHQIAKTDSEFYDEEQQKIEGFIREIRRLQYQKQQNGTHNTAYNGQHTAQHTTQHTAQHTAQREFVQEPTEKYKQKVNYDKTSFIRPEKEKTESIEPQDCEECGTAMEGKRKGTKYCSKTCSMTAQKRRRNQEYKENMQEKPITKTNYQQNYQNPNYQYNSREFDNYNAKLHGANNVDNFEDLDNFQSGDSYVFATTPVHSKHIVYEKPETKIEIDNKDLLFSCENCGKTSSKRKHHSKYCSENCRISARSKQKSNFIIQYDSFDSNGCIEWTNPQQKN